MIKFDVIVAMTSKYGIGYKGNIPWHCPEELKIFKDKTKGSILIMGSKTLESLPKLYDIFIICLTKKPPINYNNDCIRLVSLEKALEYIQLHHSHKKVFIAGGSMLYNHIFNNYSRLINKLHISIMNESVQCDTFIDLHLDNWTNELVSYYECFNHYVKIQIKQETHYLDILSNVLNRGNIRIGRNGNVKSLFSKNLKFNLCDGFPLLTTKKMFLRGIFEELMFFIKGETDTKILENKNINIWNSNTSRAFLDSLGMINRREGIMGPMYGAQWRHFNGDYDQKTGISSNGIDQLKLIIHQIKNDPTSRRILMTDYNPSQSHMGVLIPCHSLILQFYVNDGFLDLFCFNRSSDLFLGLPFNIASTSLLLILISTVCKLTPRFINITLGDYHIYEQHYNAVSTQIKRIPYKSPTLSINKELHSIEDIEKLTFKDITLTSYQYYPSIKAKMVP